jgi:hypothetical protein
MAEEKKGHIKVTIEMEVNEPLLDIVKEAIAKMPSMIPGMMRRAARGQREEEEK